MYQAVEYQPAVKNKQTKKQKIETFEGLFPLYDTPACKGYSDYPLLGPTMGSIISGSQTIEVPFL